MRLAATGDPIVIANNASTGLLTVVSDNSTVERYFKFQAISQVGGNDYSGGSSHAVTGLLFITVSNPIWGGPFSLGAISYSVVGIYITVVLAVGRFVRLSFTDMETRIMYDDLQDVDDLLLFCEGIYIARYREKLYQEEELYRRLIKIYRTPKLLVELTKRKDKAD